MTVLAVLATLATAAAAVGLWVGARRHRSTVARGYRWLSGAALFWCVGLIMQAVLAGSLSSSGAPSLADVAPLLALAVTTVGIMVLASPAAAPQAPGASGAPGPSGTRGPVVPASVLPGLADGYVTAVSLLVMGWVVAFGAEYHTSGGHPGIFLLDLLHPLADLAVLGALLPVLTTAWQRTLLPYLSLVTATGADSLGVGARISGGHEGVLQQLAMIAAAVLLGAAPWTKTVVTRFMPVSWHRDGEAAMGMASPETGPARESASVLSAPVADEAGAQPDVPGTGAGGGVATVIAAIAAGIAAIFVVVNGLASAPGSGLALVIAGGAAVLVVVVRVLMLVRDNAVAVRMWRHSGSSLRDLADRTSDMVLICDLDGTITYASPGGIGGYLQEQLVGKRLAEFVHPEDIPVLRSVVREALGLPFDVDPVSLPDAAMAGQVADEADEVVSRAADRGEAVRGRVSCRVRTADGTWRHVECAVLLYQVPGEPGRDAGHGARRQRRGRVAAAGRAPDLPRRADRPPQPRLPGRPDARSAA